VAHSRRLLPRYHQLLPTESQSRLVSDPAPTANRKLRELQLIGLANMAIRFLIPLAVLNLPEFRFGEVLVPWVATVGVLGFFAAWLVVAVMEYTGLTCYIWHLPLFFVGLVVLFSSLIGLVISP
jgi:hypothetical protein